MKEIKITTKILNFPVTLLTNEVIINHLGEKISNNLKNYFDVRFFLFNLKVNLGRNL